MSNEKPKDVFTTGLNPPFQLDPVIEAYKPGIDLSLIRHNLSLSVDERFEQLMALQRLADELREAGRRAKQ